MGEFAIRGNAKPEDCLNGVFSLSSGSWGTLIVSGMRELVVVEDDATGFIARTSRATGKRQVTAWDWRIAFD
ncbi:MAG: hypothetical protein SGI92_27215 [Bryobacteraceae bacterium]|nr:hypothetical protein [Bryobacteraceae bacterium]